MATLLEEPRAMASGTTTPDQAVNAYIQGMGNAVTKYKQNVQNCTKNPMALAAQNLDKYLAKTQDAVASGRMAAALNETPVQDWKNGCIDKGSARLASGATAAKQKVAAHFAKWMPIYANVSATVRQMPNMTTEDAINRAATAIRMLKQAAGKS